LIDTCERQPVAAAAVQNLNVDAEAILIEARDAYANYFEHWFDHDLLLAATLLDPTQASTYFLSGGSPALLSKAWTSLERLAKALTAPPPPVVAAGGAAQAAAQPGAHASLAALLAAAEGGAAAGVPAAAATLVDEKTPFINFMSENHAKLKEDQLSALGFFKKYKSRIPKIAVV